MVKSVWRSVGERRGEPRQGRRGFRISYLSSLAGLFWGGVLSAAASDWDVRVGPVWRLGGEVKSSLVPEQLTARLGRYETDTYQEGGRLNPLTGYADRQYDDGFVAIDPGTADPASYVHGVTWYWGYESGSQYQNGELAFHGGNARRHTVRTLQVDADEYSDDDNAVGLDLSATRNLWQSGAVRIGMAAGFSWFADRDYRFSGQQAVLSERTIQQQYVDYYRVNGYTPPAAPYSGTYEGPGPLLYNQPDRRESVVTLDRSSLWMADYEVETQVRHMEFRLGPDASLGLGDRVQVRVAPMLLAAYVNAESTARVSIDTPSSGTLSEETDVETSEWIWGFGLVAGADVDVGRGWTVGVEVDRSWWNEDVSLNASPFETRVDLGEWSVMANLGRRF